MAANKLCYVTQGFREDCARLIARFEKLETVRFDGFCKIWKDIKFSFVFAGRRSLMEQIEFCEDALAVAKEFFLPPLSFKERIGGLYLLYALYFKMPIDGPKIRVKMEDWRDIVEFRAEIGQAEHHDTSFILSKLMAESAFVFCLLDQELGLEKSYRMKVPGLRNTYSVLSDLKELAGPNDLFERINTLSEYYDLKKESEMKSVSGSCKGDDYSSRNLKLYDSQFGKKLLESVSRLENSRKFTNLGNVHRAVSRHDNCTNPEPFGRDKNETSKKNHAISDPIRCRLGHGFDTESSESEHMESMNESGRNDLPDSIFENSSSSE